MIKQLLINLHGGKIYKSSQTKGKIFNDKGKNLSSPVTSMGD